LKYSNLNITVVGLGLIGGSYAMAIKNKIKPQNLWGIDIDKDVLEYAKNNGIIDNGFTDSLEPIQNSDFVIICLYPGLVIKFIKENIQHFKPGAVITDTAGLKASIIKEISSILRKDIDFIGGHPLAGNEGKGIKSASEDIFQGADYLIIPTSKNRRENIKVLNNLISKIGFSNIIEMSPKDHDRMISYASHLPHIIAVSLMLNPIVKDKKFYTGGSFRDATRVANINVNLWSELLLENGGYIFDQLEIFEKNISKIKKLIIKKDAAALRGLLAKACKIKEEFENANPTY
jgi:prephenate dehydrogenase